MRVMILDEVPLLAWGVAKDLQGLRGSVGSYWRVTSPIFS